MAFPVWRRKNQRVYVYFHDVNSNKLKQVSRKLTKILDGVPKAEVHAWVQKWEADNGKAVHRAERMHLKVTDNLSALWLQYQDFKNSDSDTPRRPNTIASETAIFEKDIIPFFVGVHQKKDPKTWHEYIPDYHLHLSKRGLASATRQKILWTLKRFGESLVFSRYMTFPFAIRPPRSKVSKVTPLKTRKSPEDILSFVKGATYEAKIDFNLAILLGYFGGFGPGELFALNKEDLITGDFAESNCKTLLGFRKHKLGSRLAVVVNKTLPHKGAMQVVPLMKNDYRYGVSNIWDSEAAKLIAKLVKDKPEGRLFPYSYGHLSRIWREQVANKLRATPHDLRRASGLYLGRTIRLELTLLQEHMRHAEIETTMLYTREPSTPEKTTTKIVQDFDDVA